MTKKQTALEKTCDQVVRHVDESIHGRVREAIENREENPRDIVAERINPETGEVTHHRIPLRLIHLNDRGHEVLDPVPVAPPVSHAPMSTFDQIREYNRRMDLERSWPDATLEDEDNFDIPDDPVDQNTQWEHSFEVASVEEIFKRARHILRERKKAPPSPPEAAPPSDGPPPTPKTPAP